MLTWGGMRMFTQGGMRTVPSGWDGDGHPPARTGVLMPGWDEDLSPGWDGDAHPGVGWRGLPPGVISQSPAAAVTFSW